MSRMSSSCASIAARSPPSDAGDPVGIERIDVARDQPAKTLVGIDRHRKRAGTLEHDEPVDGAEETANRMDGLIALETVPSHHVEEYAGEPLPGRHQLLVSGGRRGQARRVEA